MDATTCPTEHELVAFNLGDLPEREQEQIAAHLEMCLDCEKALQRLECGSDSILDALGSTRDAVEPAAVANHEFPRLPGYEIVSVLGEGGMAIVYKARQMRLDRLVALKLLTRITQQRLARFRDEAEAVARLPHPNIVQIYETGEHQGRLFLALELVEGGSLADWMAGKPQPPRAAAALVEVLARAMHHAHGRGVVHRDLKPANVLLAPRPLSEVRNPQTGAGPSRSTGADLANFSPKIADFGLARMLDSGEGRTVDGEVLGTPAYMAPEQTTGANDQSGPACDVYSLAVILYELLTGRTPLQGPTTLETIRLVREAAPVRPAQLQPGVPCDLETITLKCLEKDPARRYASALDLAEDLRCFLADEPIQARPPSLTYRLVKTVRRNKLLVFATTAVLLALVIGTLFSILFAIGESQARRNADENASQATLARQAALRETYQARLAAAQVALADHDLEEAGRHLASAQESLRGWEWHYLHSRLAEESPTVLTVPAHLSPLIDLLNHGQIALTDKDDIICLTDVRSGNRVRTFPRSARCIPTNVTEGFPLLIKEPDSPWSFEDQTGRVRLCSVAIDGEPERVGLSPDSQRMAASWKLTGTGCELRFFDLSTGKPCRSDWRGAGIRRLAFSPDGKTVAGACVDGKVRVWDFATDKVSELSASTTEARGLSFSPDGTRLASGGIDGILREWELPSHRLSFTHRGHNGPINSVAYSGDGRWLASGGDDYTVRLWSTEGEEGRIVLRGLAQRVFHVAFSPDNATIVGAGVYDRIVVWPLPGLAVPSVLRAHTSYVYPVAFSPDGQWFASGGWDATIRLWDTSSRQTIGVIPDTILPVAALAISPDGKRLAALDMNGGIGIWEKASLRMVAEIGGSEPIFRDLVFTIAFSPDGSELVWGEKNRVRRWDCGTGKELESLSLPFGYIRLLAFSSDGHHLALGGFSGDVLIVDPVTGHIQSSLPCDTDRIQFLAFSPDGKRFVTAGNDRLLRLWDATSFATDAHPSPLATFKGHTQEIFAVAFHPDGTRLVSGGRDRTIHIWDLATGDELVRLPGHTNYIFSLAFSPDGRTLISGSGDYTVRVWDTAAAKSQGPAKR